MTKHNKKAIKKVDAARKYSIILLYFDPIWMEDMYIT